LSTRTRQLAAGLLRGHATRGKLVPRPSAQDAWTFSAIDLDELDLYVGPTVSANCYGLYESEQG
jgi:hypothetical protein